MSHSTRKTPDDYHELAASRGYVWLWPEVTTTKSKTSWACLLNHTWETSFSSLLAGHGCHSCSQVSKAKKMNLKEEGYHALACSRGFVCLGPIPINSRSATSWKCDKDHTWQVSYGGIRAGAGCPECGQLSAAAAMRLNQDDYEAVAAQFGIKFIGPLPTSALMKTGWECVRGHRWDAPINWIQQGYLCKKCSTLENSRSGTLSELEFDELAAKFAFVRIGPPVSDKGSPTRLRCTQQHEWSASYHSLKKGWGCPECGGTRQAKKRAKLLDSDYHELARVRGFEWLGPPVPNNQTKTNWRCSLGHAWSASYAKIHIGRGCPQCAITSSAASRRRSDEDYNSLAASRGYRWLGEPFPKNNKDKTRWSCTEGHVWLVSFGKILAGRGCPECSRETAAVKQRLSEDDYLKLASRRNFRWIGPKPSNRQAKTWWCCPVEHSWEASFANVHLGRGCPICGRESMKSALRSKDSEYEAFAETRGWTWIGPSVPNSATKTEWLCQKAHKVFSALSWLKDGNGCAHCADMVNGAKVSAIQRKLAVLLHGELNVAEGNFSIDVGIKRGDTQIAIEYDSWYYHGDRLEADRRKTKVLLERGWKVLRIRSNALLPEIEDLLKVIEDFAASKRTVHILTLSDWGHGPTFQRIRLAATLITDSVSSADLLVIDQAAGPE